MAAMRITHSGRWLFHDAALVIGCAAGLLSGCQDRSPEGSAASTSASSSLSMASATEPAQSSPSPEVPPDGMVKVPGGKLSSCRNRWEPPSKCDGEVAVDGFLLDKHEVTVAEYTTCVDAGKCSTKGLANHHACNWPHRKNRQMHPINCVGYAQAKAFCEWKGRRLPEGPEWELAARYPDGRRYAWGNEEIPWEMAEVRGPCWRKVTTCPVGNDTLLHPLGLQDMAGNVSEWTSHNAVEDPRLRRGISEEVRAIDWRVVYGTSWADPDVDGTPLLFLSKIEVRRVDKFGSPMVGFRCAK